MPIYEYQCPACGENFEKLVKVRADAPPCPECGATDVVKKVSASGFILKGGGWYKDHYGLKSSKSDSSSSDSSSSDSSASSSDSSKGETKSKSSSESAGSKAKAISKAAAKSES